ncbi:type IV secretion system protein VirB6 [Luteibacter rhizovicinus]|uniref:Type IV secretion system protein VirB6 n=1 Tax=Luteibacter rhizovicinus TaxID=242606 RepID=A0A4V2W469_9GAMM|nr:type IV secretion system protein [Luteibacter rhizovicinus]TCV94759.1 type IV secretion system protein VirB6 [Luteibacter rhizovicinus]
MASLTLASDILGGTVETITAAMIEQSTRMMTIISPIAHAMLVCYVLLWGAAIASGRTNQPLGDAAIRVLRIVLIVSFALTVGIYQNDIATFFMEVPSGIAAGIVDVPSSKGNTPGIAQVLDAALNRGYDTGKTVWNYASRKFGLFRFGYIVYFFVAIAIYIVVSVVVAIATALVFLGFVALAVLLAVGPLFILMALFDNTRRFFDAWLGQTVNFGVLFILVASTIDLCFRVFTKVVGGIQLGGPAEAGKAMIIVIGVGIAMIITVLQTRPMAAAISGGVAASSQGLSQFVLGKVSGGLSMAGSKLLGSGNPVGRGISQATGGTAGTGQQATSRVHLKTPRSTPGRPFR